MYGNQFSSFFDDFVITFDDLLLGKILNRNVVRNLSEEDYLVLRAELRSEILFSSTIHEEISKKCEKFLDIAKAIPDFGDNIFDLSKSIRQYGGLAATNTLTRAGVQIPEFDFAAGSSYMGGGSFSYFDSLLLEKFIPIQTLASISPTKQKAICSLIKLEIATSEAVEKLLDKKVKDISLSKGK